MKLERITVSGENGLKGQVFDVPLTGVDIFTGPNGAGKSTRLAAVLAGLRGLATTPTDAEREYLGPELPNSLVRLEFSGGRVVTRDLAVGRGKAHDVATALATEIAGPHLVRWDLGDFMRGTDAARTKLLDRVSGASSWTQDRAVAWLRDRLELAAGQRHEVDALCKSSKAATVDAWLVAVMEKAREAFTTANATARQSAMAADVQAAERRQRGDAPDLVAARERLAHAEREAGELRAIIEGAGASDAAVESHRARGARLVQDVAAANDALAHTEAELVTRRAALDGVRKREVAHAAVDTRAAEEAVSVAARNAADAAAVPRGIAAEIVALEQRSPASGRDEVCQHCAGVDPLDRAGEAVEHGAKLVKLRADLEDAESAETMAAMVRRRAEKVLADLRAEADRMAVARAAWEREHAAREADVRSAEQNAAHARTTLAGSEARLSAHTSEPAPVGAVVDESVRARAAAADEVLADARRAVEEAVRGQEREAAFQRAIAAREEAKTKLAEIKAAGGALKALRELLVTETFGPLQARANELLELAGSDLRASFVDAASYGAKRGEVFIHFASLSDAERAIVGAAVAYALARLSAAPWRAVILDRMEVIDAGRLPGVVSALETLVARGELDNAIGAYTCTGPVAGLGAAQRWIA